MPKNKLIKKQPQIEEDFDYSDIMDSDYYDEETMEGMMGEMIDASNNQIVLAMELTRLAVENSASECANPDEVLSIFKKASGVVAESFPLAALLSKLQMNN